MDKQLENKNDKLDQIFQKQNELDSFIRDKRKLDFTEGEWVQKKCLALICEISEVLEEVNYKWWKNEKELSYEHIKEEIVDLVHFVVGMSIDVGMTSEEMFSIYMNKNSENLLRQEGKSSKKGYELTNKDTI